MNLEKAIIRIDSRNSIEAKQPKLTLSDYKLAFEKSTAECNDFKDVIFELRTVLTKHKVQLQSSAKSISQ